MGKHEILDMTGGPFFKKILYFSVPLMLTGVLQLVYNAADLIVVGRYAGSECLAAVGSTSSLINLILNVFIGLSAGAGVVVANSIGAQNHEKISKSVHTSIALSLISSAVVTVIGFFGSNLFLRLMGTPGNVLPLADVYLKIIFLGAPGTLLFNFGASVLRATGDTKRPLYYLTFSGLINVVLNLIFVIGFHMDVDGVAIATTVSQYLCAGLTAYRLFTLQNECRVFVRKIRIHSDELAGILRIGLPAGIQGSLFSISNVIIQSTINSFGSVAMAGNAAAMNYESLVWLAANAVSQTAMTFSSQNMGAGKYRNFRKIYFICTAFEMVISFVSAAVFIIFSDGLIGIFSEDPAVIEMGSKRIYIIVSTYFLCCLMDVTGYQIRGMGRSTEPMVMTLVGVCGIRILWIYAILPLHRTIEFLLVSYPVSWFIASAALIIFYFVNEKKLLRINNLN